LDGEIWVGVDVSKLRLDVGGPAVERSVDNNQVGIKLLTGKLKEARAAAYRVGSNRGYEYELTFRLMKAGLTSSVGMS
jgi:hypothetical protein